MTIEGDVEVKKGEKGSDFVTGVGVGMDGRESVTPLSKRAGALEMTVA